MDVNGRKSKDGDIGMTENKRSSGEYVVMISGEEKTGKRSYSEPLKEVIPKLEGSVDSNVGVAKSGPMRCPSPEISRFCPSPNKPPKIPTTETLNQRKPLTRSIYSKPKSRFGDQSVPLDSNIFDEVNSPIPERTEQGSNSPFGNVSNRTSPSNNKLRETIRTMSIATPRTPLMGSPGPAGGFEENEEIYQKVNVRNKLKYKRVKVKALIEWIAFVCIVGCLICSFTVRKFEKAQIWGLEIWKWFVLVLVTFSGLLVSRWVMQFVVFLIELNYLFKKKVLYFVHGLKKSVQVCIWFTLILVTWVLLFNNDGVKRSPAATKILNYITWTIISLLVGGFLWLLKTLLLKILASSFHVTTFFDRIQESVFHQYVLRALSGPPLLASAARGNSNISQLSFRSKKKGKEGKKKEVIDINKLHQMKQEKVSAWTMKMLVDVISTSGLSTISNVLDETEYEGGNEQADKEISSEMEAIAAAYHIFRNVALPGCRYIDEQDLRRFMIKEEVDLVFPLIDVAETGHIDMKSLTEWVLKVYTGRKALSHALNDTKTAVKQLNKLVTGILVIIIIVIWLLLVGIATTKVLVLLSSQLVVAAFIFGNTCKTIFEAIIFVFVMHPFDVGDRCVIDGVQMIVEEMNILTTVFLRFDNEKIFFPNSVLATKAISNFYRSPDMGDSLEFSIDFRTPIEKIGALKEKVKKYLEKNPQYWYPNHNMVVKEIENVNKIKMALFFNHTMNFQNFGEKSRRRSELVIEMKKIFDELHIRYDLLPQEVHLAKPASAVFDTIK
jgi:small-conductance mechanosensitive channel